MMTNQQSNEAAIRQLLAESIIALHDKNLDGIMAMYAPNVVSFDIVPPLQYRGTDAFRKVWEEIFTLYQGPIIYEIHDLDITASEDIAFSHSLNRIRGTMTTGQQTDMWLRWTACFRKIDGKWLIVHHQNSVPVYMETGKAALDLKP